MEVFKVSLEDSTAFFGADRVDIPGGGPQGFLPGQSSSSSCRLLNGTDEGIHVVFRTFPRGKKSAGLGPHSGSELSADFNPSTLSAHQTPPEPLVDLPVPQVPERPSRRQLIEVVAEDEEEEEVVGSRFLPHFRPRRWCRHVLAGSICPRGRQCTFAHHESELHPDS